MYSLESRAIDEYAIAFFEFRMSWVKIFCGVIDRDASPSDSRSKHPVCVEDSVIAEGEIAVEVEKENCLAFSNAIVEVSTISGACEF